jgi:hypothetical protein
MMAKETRCVFVADNIYKGGSNTAILHTDWNSQIFKLCEKMFQLTYIHILVTVRSSYHSYLYTIDNIKHVDSDNSSNKCNTVG